MCFLQHGPLEMQGCCLLLTHTTRCQPATHTAISMNHPSAPHKAKQSSVTQYSIHLHLGPLPLDEWGGNRSTTLLGPCVWALLGPIHLPQSLTCLFTLYFSWWCWVNIHIHTPSPIITVLSLTVPSGHEWQQPVFFSLTNLRRWLQSNATDIKCYGKEEIKYTVRQLTSVSVRVATWVNWSETFELYKSRRDTVQPVQRYKNSPFSQKAACPDRALALRLAVKHITQRTERGEGYLWLICELVLTGCADLAAASSLGQCASYDEVIPNVTSHLSNKLIR